MPKRVIPPNLLGLVKESSDSDKKEAVDPLTHSPNGSARGDKMGQ